ncbi:MAG: DsrE family protein [Holophagaceae bacterium]|nr:DsrE family protein [Holophagaceae bacterium]
MNIGIILETNEPEKAWNAVRFANTALKRGREVRLFLMSAGVEAESITHEKYNVRAQLQEFSENRGLLLACGTCIKGRGQGQSELCPISTMADCLDMVEWADRVVTF